MVVHCLCVRMYVSVECHSWCSRKTNSYRGGADSSELTPYRFWLVNGTWLG
jgi:hypothetical protein